MNILKLLKELEKHVTDEVGKACIILLKETINQCNIIPLNTTHYISTALICEQNKKHLEATKYAAEYINNKNTMDKTAIGESYYYDIQNNVDDYNNMSYFVHEKSWELDKLLDTFKIFGELYQEYCDKHN